MQVALVATALAAASALLAPPHAAAITIGQGSLPGLTVDPAGTAFLAWPGPESGSTTLRFCRLPRAATACDAGLASTIAAPGSSLSRPFLVVTGSRVVIVQHRFGGDVPGFFALYAFTSADRGVTFGPGKVVGKINAFEAITGPGDTLSAVTNVETDGLKYQNTPIDGSAPVVANGPGAGTSTVGSAVLSTDHLSNGTVGLIDAATPLAAFTDASANAQFRRYDGNGDVNDVANWTPAVELGKIDFPKLAGGPKGLFLLGTSATGEILSRRFDGTTFGAPVGIGSQGSAPTLHAFQDAGGRLHVVFRRNQSDGLHLVHAVSDDGVAWRSGSVVIQNVATDGDINDTRIATAADHVGVAAWRAGQSEIRVAAVGPDVPTAPKPPVTQPPVTTVPVTPPPPALRPVAAFKLTTATVAGGRVTLSSPRACVPVGTSFVATLSFKRSTRKGTRFVKVTRVDFLVDGKRKKIDTRAPFRQRLTVRALKAGTKHTLRARATIKVKTGRSPKKSISATFSVCR